MKSSHHHSRSMSTTAATINLFNNTSSNLIEQLSPEDFLKLDSNEIAAKIYRMQQELSRLREENERTKIEMSDLETELKQRNEEVYSLNEKLMFAEVTSTISQIQGNEDRSTSQRDQRLSLIQETLNQKLYDSTKLIPLIESLKCDFNIIIPNLKLKSE
jgi:hypothetical protein